ncbi:ABC1 kinase family protein [Antarctobacter jejuensis]|uniref:ABC1 kinase family protein n=1 Tax=Antarctobacter jejuensis TaxID=1439938 RepID=UPI003FD05DA5
MSKRSDRPGVAVPTSRIARAARMGGLTTSILGNLAIGATRDIARGRRPAPRDLLLTPANARRLTTELARMRGAAMKLGQLLSMESSDLMPPELAAILSQLRQDALFMPPKQLKQVLTEAYGAGFQRRFKRFDTRPVAAASIGQVHRVVAADGRALALKIQYPGIRGAIDADVANLGTLLRYSGLIPRGIDIAPLLEEARKQLHEEADYRREAAELDRFAGLLRDSPGFALPRPHRDLSTDTVLAMDFMDSRPIEVLESNPQAARDSALTRLFTLFLREVFDWHRVQTDPNFANYRLAPDGETLVLLDFGAARAFDQTSVAGFRCLLRAAANGHAEDIRAALLTTGFIRPDTPADQVDTLLRMVAMIHPALNSAQPFDFGDTTLLEQLRAEGQRLGLDQGYAEIPPIDALFLQRKLAGLVLLATRLRARVPVRDLLAPYLNAASGRSA